LAMGPDMGNEIVRANGFVRIKDSQ
jgi:hypothetical protein